MIKFNEENIIRSGDNMKVNLNARNSKLIVYVTKSEAIQSYGIIMIILL